MARSDTGTANASAMGLARSAGGQAKVKVDKNRMNAVHPPHPADGQRRPPHMNHPGDLEQFPMVS